jgi:hypothetical protein
MTDLTALLGGGAAITAIIGCWNYIKSYFHKIYAFFFITIDTVHSPGSDFNKAMCIWLLHKCKFTKFSEKRFITSNNFVKPIEKNQLIAYEIISENPLLCWYKRRPILVGGGGDKITFIRGTFTYEELLTDIMDCYNEELGEKLNKDCNRFYVRKFSGTLLDNNKKSHDDHGDGLPASPSGKAKESHFYSDIENLLNPVKWKKNEIGMIKKDEPLGHLSLSSEVLKVVDGLRLWKKSEEWYKARQIPWKNGVLMFGKPGTGKSSVAKALAMELNMPIMIFDLSSMSNNDFNSAWSRVKGNAPCMCLFEDIDSIFNKRQNITGNEGGITFETILNSLDGIESSDGLLTVITTNNIEAIDEAIGKPSDHGISTRPGRINACVKLDNPDKEGYAKIAKRILTDFPNTIDKVIAEAITHGDSGAQFQERCSKLALSLFWQNK